jgi:hypothetical protein
MGFVHYIYSRRFGWAPLRFLIRGRDFYEERGRWLVANGVYAARPLCARTSETRRVD